MSMFDEMDDTIEKFNVATNKLKRCKGKDCKAVGGIGHSDECEKEYSRNANKIPTKEVAPKCFDRAESGGRVFYNCRYIHTCKNVKPICVDNPPDWEK